MITEETIARVKSSLQSTKSFLALEVIEELEKENAELNAKLNHTLCVECTREYLKEIGTLKEQIEKMKKNCLEVMRVQESNLTDNYMAGMYNGMVTVYNSCFLTDNELEKSYCSKNEYNKWELPE